MSEEQPAPAAGQADSRRRAGQRSPLAHPDWRYVERTALDAFDRGDWELLDRQRGPYLGERMATQALAMLAAQKDEPTFGYQINNYEHCLQAATLALRDGLDEETVVCTLFHDLGFIVCNETHGELVAALLGPYVSDRNLWMLERHMYFLSAHCREHPGADPAVRDRWRGHPWFEYTARWVARYDQNAIDPAFESEPLSVFEPIVRRVFTRPPKARRPPP
jgi:predicted HD phosphohydrolase